MTGPIPPMLATLGTLPSGGGWAYEYKWDGVRAVAYLSPAGARILSRNERDVTASYPDITALLSGSPVPHRSPILDGEIVALDAAGHPSFARLQTRMNVLLPSPGLVAGVPLTYHVFDLLSLDGTTTLALPYAERRALLAGLDLGGGAVTVPDSFVEDSPARVVEAARAGAYEGVVAKRLASPYQPGHRSPDWIKAPFIHTQEVLILGWTTGAGRRAGTIGALLVGVPDDGGAISFAGGVGTGFTDAMLRDLQARLEPLSRDTPPAADVPRSAARDAHWVEPEVVGEVEYRSWTSDGRLRHSSWRGLRPDRRPDEVHADRPR
jgi:bifunctional non-homologous end joining protein LigD